MGVRRAIAVNFSSIQAFTLVKAAVHTNLLGGSAPLDKPLSLSPRSALHDDDL